MYAIRSYYAGNHYLEVQEVSKIYDEKAAEAFGIKQGQIIVSIHCGSRALGHQIGTEYMVSLAKAAKRLGISRITSYNVCYTKLLRFFPFVSQLHHFLVKIEARFSIIV